MANTSADTPNAKIAEPNGSGSNSFDLMRYSGMTKNPQAMASAPIGTLIQNAHCQPPASMSSPPKNGPIAAATPPTADHVPIAAPRRSFGNAAKIVAAPAGRVSEDANAWATRAMMSTVVLGASAATAEASENAAVPQRIDRLRPNLSPIAPASTRAAAPTMLKAVITHESSASEASGKASVSSG